MSHYSCLVVGKDPEYQLAPFHEFECTGRDDEFVQDVDVTKEVLGHMEKESASLQDALDYFGLAESTVAADCDIHHSGDHKYGYAIVAGDVLIKAVDRTNPNKKWDYWVIGGRFSDKILRKTGTRDNAARKSEIDFDRLRQEKLQEADKDWHSVHAIIDPLPKIVPWTVVREDKFPNDIDAAREFYHGQEAVAALHAWNKTNSYPLGALMEFESLLCPLESYLKVQAELAFNCFAFVRNRKWAERGKMGWWGMVADEKDDETWSSIFQKLLADVPDSEWLTVVDCHI